MNTKTILPVLAMALLLLSACSGVMDSAQPAKQIYMLMPLSGSQTTASPEQGPALSISLAAVPGLDTDWIQALGDDARLTRYANARWPDHLPEVLASVIQRSFVSSGRFSTVEQSSRVTADGWLLQLEVEKFYGLQNTTEKTGSVVTQLSGSIECNGRVDSFSLSETVAVSGERLSSVVAAHQQGLDDVTRQLLKTVFAECS
jgi:ABC-type uncharacterized transport system auxiliary subunit